MVMFPPVNYFHLFGGGFYCLQAEPLIAARARLRQLASQNNNAAKAVTANLPELERFGETRDELAEMSGVSARKK